MSKADAGAEYQRATNPWATIKQLEARVRELERQVAQKKTTRKPKANSAEVR